MKKPLIIGMAGKMGSGKDTAGNYLINEYQFQRIAFADNLKEMAMKVFNLTYQQCYDQDLKMVNFKKAN
jgi:dephospho-CoA kinase